MPPRKAEGLTIAFLGTGSMDVDAATDLVEELIESAITSDEDFVRFVFPLTTDEFSDTLAGLVKMAQESDVSYEVITATGDKSRRGFNDITSGAAKAYNVADVFLQMEQILNDSPKAILEVLWDKEREEELGEIVGRFVDAGIDVKDLTDGNVPMGEEEDEAEAEAESGQAVTVVADEADEEELPIYARSDLEKLSRAEVKDIAAKLGLPPRKSSAAMIDEIMEAQGEPGEAVATVIDMEAVGVAEVITMSPGVNVGDLVQTLDAFPGRLHDVLDEFVTSLGKTIEGVVFNATPEKPMAVEEPAQPRRRLTRAR
jgi:hypothetical protein